MSAWWPCWPAKSSIIIFNFLLDSCAGGHVSQLLLCQLLIRLGVIAACRISALSWRFFLASLAKIDLNLLVWHLCWSRLPPACLTFKIVAFRPRSVVAVN